MSDDVVIEISDRCQFSGCTKKTVVWCNGLAACEDHERWLMALIGRGFGLEDVKGDDDA